MFMRPYLFVCTLLLCFGLISASAQESGLTKKEKISRIRDAAKRDSQAIPTLTDYLKDSDVDVRDEAVKAIVNIGTQYSLDPLIKATHDNDPGVQIRAVDGLVNFYVPGYVTRGGVTHTFTRVSKRIKSELSTGNDQVVGPSVSARADVIGAIAELITGGASIDSRSEAARAAGILRGRAALPELEKALQSKHSGLILESLFAIQKLRDTSAGLSVAVLVNDFDTDVQTTALDTLGILHHTDAAGAIRQIVSRPRNNKVRRAALQALAMFALPEDRSTFEGYKNDKDEDLRASALEGLGRVRDPDDIAALQTAYDNERDMKPRLAAAFGIVNEGKTEMSVYSPLQYLVNGLDSSKANSISQAYLLELSRRPAVRKALLPILPNATKGEKLGLIHALAPSADAETTEALRSLTKDPDSDISIAAARSEALRPKH
jgi:HEAT repeat protein